MSASPVIQVSMDENGESHVGASRPDVVVVAVDESIPVKPADETTPLLAANVAAKIPVTESAPVTGDPASPVAPVLSGSAEPPPTEESKALAEAAAKELALGWIQSSERREGNAVPEFLQNFVGVSLGNALSVFVVCFITYIMAGWLGLGLAWMFPIWLVFAVYYDTSMTRLRRNIRDDTYRKLTKDKLETDAESTEWMNNFLNRFWLIYEPVISQTVVGIANPILEYYTPGFLNSVRLSHFTLGNKAPRVEEVRTYPRTEQDVVMMDWRFSFVPNDVLDLTTRQIKNKINPKVVLAIRVGKGLMGADIPILVEDMVFQGHMRFKIRLQNNFPHINTVDVSFLEPPTIDYVLKPIGGETLGFDIAHFPGLAPFIRDTINSVLEPMMYAPNVFTLDVNAMMQSAGELSSAIGVLKITVRSAKVGKSGDLLSGTMDPYVKMNIGNRAELARTTIKDNTHQPSWDETFYLLVENLQEDMLFEINDENGLAKDTLVGNAKFSLTSLEEQPLQEEVPLKITSEKGKEKGDLSIGAWYYPVAKPIPQEDGTLQPVESKVGILRVIIHQAKELDFRKSVVGQLSPYAQLLINGKRVKKTKILKRNNNPVWEEITEIFVSDLDDTTVGVTIDDDRELAVNQSLGSWELKAMTAVERTAAKIDWFNLNNAEMGKLKISCSWKPIVAEGERFSSSLGPPIGVVRFGIKEAKDLFNTEMTGVADPYLRIRSGSKILGKTRVIYSNRNPTWDEIFYVPVHRPQETFTLEVFDWNNLKQDKIIGRTEVNVASMIVKDEETGQLSAADSLDLTVKLAHNADLDRGQLVYGASFHPSIPGAGDCPLPKVIHAATADPSAPGSPVVTAKALPTEVAPEKKAIDYTQFKAGVLQIRVHKATGFSRKADVLARIVLNKNEYDIVNELPIIKKTIAPEWEESSQCFVKETEFGILSIIFRNADSDKGEELGRLNVDVHDILRDMSDGADNKAYSFQTFDGETGQVNMSFLFFPIEITLDPSESLLNMGQLQMEIIDAKNLPAVDSSGTSDPYVLVTLDGEKVFKSKPVKKNLNPVFKEMFNLPITSRTKTRLIVEVFDWNQIATDEILGSAVIDLTTLEPREPLERTIPLVEHPNASIRVRMNFTPGFVSFVMRRSTTMSALTSAVNPINQMKTVGYLGKSAAGAVGGTLGGMTGGVKTMFGKKKEAAAPVLTAPEVVLQRTATEVSAATAVATDAVKPVSGSLETSRNTDELIDNRMTLA